MVISSRWSGQSRIFWPVTEAVRHPSTWQAELAPGFSVIRIRAPHPHRKAPRPFRASRLIVRPHPQLTVSSCIYQFS
jgi:hypothetical protein